jgi:glycosyltransferase involved in cell wall biosynthesis
VFDGVICFGGCDWWYHNQGHYDLQMMRRFSRSVPVVYVNSIGIRVPKLAEGSMFFKRVARKLRSWSRGFVRVRDGFAVVSPIVVPGRRGLSISRRLLWRQVVLAGRRMGIRRPLVWITTPSAIGVADEIDPVGIVYERTDRWEAFPEADPDEIREYDRRAKMRADLSLYCSRLLFHDESSGCRNAQYVDHGVDFERFATAGDLAPANEPADLRRVARPRVGFVGAIDAHTFDPALFVETARRLSEVQFVLVGACTIANGWCGDLKNVHLLGRRPYEQVAAYMAACDVLIMPWNRSDWIKACNPVKLKEYLAVGRPVVSTDFDELSNYSGYVHLAPNASGFVDLVSKALAAPANATTLRRRVVSETWENKHERVLMLLSQQGLIPIYGRRATSCRHESTSN